MAITAAALWGVSPVSNSAAALYTSPAGTTTTIIRAAFTNITASGVALTVWVVRSGGGTANSNILTGASAAGYSLPAGPNLPYVPTEMANLVLGPGDAVWALASTASAINSVGSGYKQT